VATKSQKNFYVTKVASLLYEHIRQELVQCQYRFPRGVAIPEHQVRPGLAFAAGEDC
jgi:hypothetical protein